MDLPPIFRVELTFLGQLCLQVHQLAGDFQLASPYTCPFTLYYRYLGIISLSFVTGNLAVYSANDRSFCMFDVAATSKF